MSKNVQISSELFCEIYFLVEKLKQDELDPDLLMSIDKQISEKFHAVKKRELYSKIQTAKTDQEREAAQKKYAEFANIPQSFRY